MICNCYSFCRGIDVLKDPTKIKDLTTVLLNDLHEIQRRASGASDLATVNVNSLHGYDSLLVGFYVFTHYFGKFYNNHFVISLGPCYQSLQSSTST